MFKCRHWQTTKSELKVLIDCCPFVFDFTMLYVERQKCAEENFVIQKSLSLSQSAQTDWINVIRRAFVDALKPGDSADRHIRDRK